MKHESRVEEELRRVGSRISASRSVVDDVMQRVDQMPTPVRQRTSFVTASLVCGSLAICFIAGFMVGVNYGEVAQDPVMSDPTQHAESPKTNQPSLARGGRAHDANLEPGKVNPNEPPQAHVVARPTFWTYRNALHTPGGIDSVVVNRPVTTIAALENPTTVRHWRKIDPSRLFDHEEH